jgi:hypothetical protein
MQARAGDLHESSAGSDATSHHIAAEFNAVSSRAFRRYRAIQGFRADFENKAILHNSHEVLPTPGDNKECTLSDNLALTPAKFYAQGCSSPTTPENRLSLFFALALPSASSRFR